jgi:cytochrome P450
MRTNYPPQPRPRFFSGHYFDFYQDQLTFLTNSAKNFGDIVYFRFFHVPIYLLNNPDLIEEVLANAELRKSKGVRTPLQQQLFGNGLIASEGDFWLKQRRMLQQVFNQKYLAKYAETVIETAEEFFSNWKDGDQRVVNEEFIELTLKIASKTFFGIDDLKEKGIVRELVESLKAIYSTQKQFSWFADNFLPTLNNRRFKKAVKAVDQLIGRIIEERHKNKSDVTDLLSVLLSMSVGNSDKQIRDEIVTFFIAAHETTAIALTWAWILLAQNGTAQEKMRAEIKALDSDKLSFNDLSGLTFTSQILKESLRLFPPNRSTAREVVKPFKIKDFNIPRGAQLVMSQWVMHRDSRYWESPDKFIPERWTPEFERSLPKYAYFPFGLGNRKCIGKSFAMMEMALVLIVIARKFQFTLDSPDEIKPVPVLLLEPQNALSITVKTL